MKRENRDGTPPRRERSEIPALDETAFVEAASRPDSVVIDTRRDRDEYLAGHWKGSIWAPWGGADFLAIAGSYVEPEETIVLVGDPQLGDRMATALYRIGLDRVVGIAPVETLKGALVDSPASIQSVGWDTVREQMAQPGVDVLDVRRASEFKLDGIAGAANIAHTRLRDRVGELDRDKKHLVHCRTGHRATAAVSYLERQGFDVVHVGDKIADWDPELAGAATASAQST